MSGDASKVPGSGSAGPRRLLTFRLDQERRQRLAARLAREGRTMSEVVIHGLRQYVHARHGDSPGSSSSPGLVHHRSSASSKLVLPDRVAILRKAFDDTMAELFRTQERLQAVRGRLKEEPTKVTSKDGMVTEAGEIADHLKKVIFYGKPLDRTNLIEELGDMFWYMALMCDALSVDFEDVWRINIAKLKARYGEKFSEERAVNRDLVNERIVLSGSYSCADGACGSCDYCQSR